MNVAELERSSWSDIIKSACSKLADSADRLLIASVVGENAAAPSKSTVTLWPFVHKLKEEASTYANEGADIIYTSSLDDDLAIEVNAPLLEAALLELLKNALQNIPGGHAVLKTEVDAASSMLIFSVTDSGPGIPKEHREKVFDWFYKIDPYKPGMGLGLPLCREIAAMIGGNVYLDERNFSGTRMCLEIPLITER